MSLSSRLSKLEKQHKQQLAIEAEQGGNAPMTDNPTITIENTAQGERPKDFAMSQDLTVSLNGAPMMKVQRVHIVVDYAKGGIPRANIEGFLMRGPMDYMTALVAEMIVTDPQTGKRYRLVEADPYTKVIGQ